MMYPIYWSDGVKITRIFDDGCHGDAFLVTVTSDLEKMTDIFGKFRSFYIKSESFSWLQVVTTKS